MKRVLFRSLAIMALSTFACACGESRSPTNETQRYVALDHAAEAARVAAGAKGLALAVVEHGELGHAVGFGQQSVSRTGAVTANTQFRVGSMTKLLTAIGVLELVDAGKVDLDAPVVKYVPGFTLTANPEDARSITIQQLLTHSSGLPDVPVAWSNWPDTSDAVLGEYLTSKAFADKYRLVAPPGRLWMYSNLGFDLLGLVIERVTRWLRAVVYIVNKQGTYLDQILRSALATLADQPELPIASWPEDPSHFGRYVGHYTRTDSAGNVDVTVVDNKVRVQTPGRDCTLESVAPGSLRCAADGSFYSFLPTDGAKVEYLRALENIGEWVATREPAND